MIALKLLYIPGFEVQGYVRREEAQWEGTRGVERRVMQDKVLKQANRPPA